MKKKQPQQTLSYSLKIEYIGFRDRELEDTLIPDIGLEFYKKFGVYCIFAGTGNISPDAYVERLMTGTQTSEPSDWNRIPPTQEIYFELDRFIDKEIMSEFMMHLCEHWGTLIPIVSFAFAVGVHDIDDDESYERKSNYEITVYDLPDLGMDQ